MGYLQANQIRFAEFSFDLETSQLFRGEELLKLEPQPTKLLRLILERGGEVVSRESARTCVWGTDTHVDFDQGLAYCIRRIRRVLNDEGSAPRFVETIPRVGYRLLVPTERSDAAAATPGEAELIIEPISEPALPQTGAASQWRPRALAGAGVCALALLAFAWGSRKPQAVSARSRTIVVLAFTNEGKDPADNYVGAGLAEDIVVQLAAMGGVPVVLAPETPDLDPIKAAKRASASRALVGTFRKEGQHFRITARLVDGETGTVQWSNAYDRDTQTIVRLQTEIANAIAKSIGAPLRERRQASKDWNSAAVDNFYRGVYVMRRDHEGIDSAVEFLREAVRLEPEFPEALATLATALCRQAAYASRRSIADAASEAEPYAEKAALLAPELAETQAAIANVSLEKNQLALATVHFRRALELNPRDEMSREGLMVALSSLGRFSEAISAGQEGMALDPLSVNVQRGLGQTLERSGRYEEALVELRKAEKLDPANTVIYSTESEALIDLRRYEEASRVFGKYTHALEGERALFDAYIAFASGDRQRAKRIADRLPGHHRKARLYSAIGDLDASMVELEKLVSQHGVFLHWLKVDPELENVRRNHPGYPELLRRAGF